MQKHKKQNNIVLKVVFANFNTNIAYKVIKH